MLRYPRLRQPPAPLRPSPGPPRSTSSPPRWPPTTTRLRGVVPDGHVLHGGGRRWLGPDLGRPHVVGPPPRLGPRDARLGVVRHRHRLRGPGQRRRRDLGRDVVVAIGDRRVLRAPTKVSCPTTTFCAATGANGTAGGASTLATSTAMPGRRSRRRPPAATDDRLVDVSCASATFCLAVNLDGLSLAFDGTSWSAVPSAAARGTVSVSCPVASTCWPCPPWAPGPGSREDAWSSPTVVPALQGAFASSLSCSSATRCTAVGLSGKATSWNGAWSSPTPVFHDGYLATVDVSCAPTGPCVAVNSKGDAAVSS